MLVNYLITHGPLVGSLLASKLTADIFITLLAFLTGPCFYQYLSPARSCLFVSLFFRSLTLHEQSWNTCCGDRTKPRSSARVTRTVHHGNIFSACLLNKYIHDIYLFIYLFMYMECVCVVCVCVHALFSFHHVPSIEFRSSDMVAATRNQWNDHVFQVSLKYSS